MTNKTILIIDDDTDFLSVLNARCETAGLVVKHAHNLLTATMIVAKCVPDIICVDVQMPTGNGLKFCESLAADPATAHVPIVVLTGHRDMETQQACQRLRAYYVEKTDNYWSTLEPLLRQLAAETLPGVEPQQDLPRNRNRLSDSATASPKALMVATNSVSDAKQIVVADDDEDILKLLSQRLSSLGCSVFGVDNALDAINLIHRITPDLVCLDVGMPSGNGLSVSEMMASTERLRTIPVIILTGRSDESTIRRCHNMMVYYVQKSADTWQRVEPLVRELLHIDAPAIAVSPKPQPARPAAAASPSVAPKDDRHDLMDAVFAALGADSGDQGASSGAYGDPFGTATAEDVPWVLCIDDDAEFTDVLRIRLEQYGVAVMRAFNGMEGFRMAFTSPAGAILLDYTMPNGQGDYVLGRLKDNPVTADIPVIIITGTRDKVLERRMLAMGAAAYFEKPVSMDRLRDELAKYIDILEDPEPSPSRNVPRTSSHLALNPMSK